MLNIDEINSIIEMLNLTIRRTENGEYEITDYNRNITDKLKKNSNGSYEYSFIKDDTNYYLTINNKGLSLTNSLKETFNFTANGFEYFQKKENKDENKSVVTIASPNLSFYQSTDTPIANKDHYYISIKAFTMGGNISLYKVSESISLNGTLKKDMTVSYDEEGVYKTEVERHYNESGKLTNSSNSEPEELGSNYYDFIVSDMASHDHVWSLLDRLEMVFKGISNKLITYNNNLGFVIEKIKTNSLNY